MKLKKVNKSKLNKVEPEVKKYNSLDEIMDFTRPFYMYYSGVEDKNNFDVLYEMGIRNFLMSYHYVQNRKFNTQEYTEKGVKFFIDSGAYTYQVDLKYQDYTVEQWEELIEKYLKWARKHKDAIFAIANMDLENLLGTEVVREWNERYFEPFMLETGIPVCFIWHPVSGDDGWIRYCQRYPYVGMSWVSDEGTDLDFSFGFSMLKTAEKYNALVHGMGMTRTQLLTKLPFYTVDSTTWLVGLQYGEINYWTGQKMTRLKKDKWKGQMLPQLTSLGFNQQKLLDEDMEEMIRVNIYAFIQAEEFIQERLKSSMYWMKPKSNKKNDISEVEFPPVEWFKIPHGQRPDVEKYAKELNISLEDISNAETFICDVTCFINIDKEGYSELFEKAYTPELIKDLHDTLVNRIVQSDEERIDDLIAFYTDCVLGNNDTLLLWGTNFDRIVKEREEYIIEEEFDYEEVTPVALANLTANYLPKPKEGEDIAPEISELDDEIFSNLGLEAVRNEKGQFVKAVKKVGRPKKLYSEKYPKLACDTCMNSQRCPEYKAGYVCAYNKMFSRYNTRDMKDVLEAMQGIVDLSMQRLQRSMVTEMLQGGIPDQNVTNMMNQSMNLLDRLHRMYLSGEDAIVRQTKVIRSDGTQETTTQITSNPQSGGILAQIFGNITNEMSENIEQREEKKQETEEPPIKIIEAEVIE